MFQQLTTRVERIEQRTRGSSFTGSKPYPRNLHDVQANTDHRGDACSSIYYALGLFVFQTLLRVKAQVSPDATAIRGLEEKWADAYRARRVDVLSSLIADDYVITFEDGSVYSKVGLISENAQPNKHVDLAEICRPQDSAARRHSCRDRKLP